MATARRTNPALRALAVALTFLAGPLLPRPYRRFWPWPELQESGALQLFHAYLHAVASVVVWMTGLVAFVKAFGDRYTEALMDPQHGTGDPSYLTWYGLIGFFAFLVSPGGILKGLYMADSVVRAVGGAMHRTVPGTLFLALPLGLVGVLARRAREQAMTARYGPPGAPDRLEVRGESLFVWTTRPRDEWHNLLAFSHGGRLYRLVWRGEVSGGARRAFEHRFEPWPGAMPVRRVVLLDPAPGASTPAR